jgi:hypothetical protein
MDADDTYPVSTQEVIDPSAEILPLSQQEVTLIGFVDLGSQ